MIELKRVNYVPFVMPKEIKELSPGQACNVLMLYPQRSLKDFSDMTEVDVVQNFVDPENVTSFITEEGTSALMCGSNMVMCIRKDYYKYDKTTMVAEYEKLVKDRNILIVSKETKRELETYVKQKMRAAMFPLIKLIWFYFDYSAERIYVLSKSQSDLAIAIGMLEKAFACNINMLNYASFAMTNNVAPQMFLQYLYQAISEGVDLSKNYIFGNKIKLVGIKDEYTGNAYGIEANVIDHDKVIMDLTSGFATIEEIQLEAIEGLDSATFMLDSATLIPYGIRLPKNKKETTDKLQKLSDQLNFITAFDMSFFQVLHEFVAVANKKEGEK